MRLILLIRINCLKSRDFYNKVLLVWWWLGVRSKFLPCALCDNIYDENIHSFPVWCHIFTLYSAVFEMLPWVKKKKKGLSSSDPNGSRMESVRRSRSFRFPEFLECLFAITLLFFFVICFERVRWKHLLTILMPLTNMLGNVVF